MWGLRRVGAAWLNFVERTYDEPYRVLTWESGWESYDVYADGFWLGVGHRQLVIGMFEIAQCPGERKLAGPWRVGELGRRKRWLEMKPRRPSAGPQCASLLRDTLCPRSWSSARAGPPLGARTRARPL